MIGLVAAASLLGASFDLPTLPPIRRDPQVTYLDRTGVVLGVRGGKFPPPVDVDKLPPYVPAAFVAIEDRRFYEHAGFDPVGIARAIVSDLGHGGAREGASTITQQLARNLFLGSERTIERKGQELLLAMELEQKFTKKQILGLYLSRVYFGSGAYGIDAAAHRFFNKPAARLTVREAAMLAAVMKSPTNYNPIEQPDASAQRATLVLDAMVQTGAITEAAKAKAVAQRPKVWRSDPDGPAGYFIDWVDAQVHGKIGAARQDLVVDTTLDQGMELAAGEQARAVVARHAAQGIQQAALVALDGAGHVRAMVGGVDYASAPYNRAVEAHRQAGSAWKPFVYLAAMEAGRTPETLAVDEPVTIDGWSPRDFEDGFMGQITLSQALAHSINTIAAKLADDIGRDRVAIAARRLGIVSPINTEPAMALGTTLVTPLEMAQAYDAFANGGSRATASGLVRVRTLGGAVLYQRQEQPQGRRDRQSAAWRDERHASRRAGRRHRCQGGDPWLRPGGQDRHDIRLQGCLVLWLYRQFHRRGVDGARRRHANASCDRRQRARRNVARLHECGPQALRQSSNTTWSAAAHSAASSRACGAGPACGHRRPAAGSGHVADNAGPIAIAARSPRCMVGSNPWEMARCRCRIWITSTSIAPISIAPDHSTPRFLVCTTG